MKPAPSSPRGPYQALWEKRVLYAYLRMMGATQTNAGGAVGRAKRTVAAWEEDKALYAEAREEARRRWLTEISDVARQGLLRNLRGDPHGTLSLQVLERLDADLAPAKQRHDVAIEGGGLAALLAATREEPDADTPPAPSA